MNHNNILTFWLHKKFEINYYTEQVIIETFTQNIHLVQQCICIKHKSYLHFVCTPPHSMNIIFTYFRNFRTLWVRFPMGSTQPPKEMSTTNISWRGGGLRRPVRRADLTTFICRLSWNPGSLNLLETSGPFQACIGIVLLLHLPV